MSRAIPPVRQWTVRAYLDRDIAGTGSGSILLGEHIVAAVNKRFARWAARDAMRRDQLERYLATNRVTVALHRAGDLED